MSDLDRKLAGVAARQRMLVTLQNVVDAGGDVHHAKARVAGGRWRRVDRGVYLMAGAPLDWGTRQLAAVLAAGNGAVTSHLAAARVWDIPGYGRAGVEVAFPRGRRYRRKGVRTHESTDLDRCRVVVRDGIPVTDANRTLLDLGRYVGDKRLARDVEAARRAGLVTWSSLIRTVAVHARPGRHGVRRLRRVVLANMHRKEVTDSDLEFLVLGLITEAGLPEPVLHHRALDGDRFVAEIDLAYPQWKIAIECDGAIHREEEVHEADLPRQNDLALEGWLILRFTTKGVVRRPESVVNEVRAAIASRRDRSPKSTGDGHRSSSRVNVTGSSPL
jgi:hypothetical protein